MSSTAPRRVPALDDASDAQVSSNARRQVAAQGLLKTGDRIVDAKTVLTWVLTAVGAPAGLTGLLVPIRESGAMLFQAALVPWVERHAVRKWVWVIGGGIQALAVLAMASVVATLEGAGAGAGVLLALAVFALARSLTSVASKDVLGRTVPKGRRGQVTGWATVASGLAAVTVGVGMRTLGGEDTSAATFGLLLAVGALAWVAAAGFYASVREPASDPPAATGRSARDEIAAALALLRDDAPLRRFVLARTLLLISALAPPFVVVLAGERSGTGLSGLGAFVISAGVASLVGGRLWGGVADRSSRTTMMIASGAASTIVIVFLVVLAVPGVAELSWIYPAAYLLLALAHTGARIGRQTYVVDLAEGDQRTEYAAVSNSAMGVLLLLAGVLSSLLATFGAQWALGLLAVLGAAGVPVARSLPEVSSVAPHARG